MTEDELQELDDIEELAGKLDKKLSNEDCLIEQMAATIRTEMEKELFEECRIVKIRKDLWGPNGYLGTTTLMWKL